ncbi:MAG: helix-turn-helix domain-containing protein [Acetobacter sp.]|nr:helix-turn-helix domain-containing protein [Acetobacter sp.]
MPRGRKRKADMLANDMPFESGIGPMDAHVGGRICARRRLLQLSQKEMADALGITFQQVQKYEKGVNRIGAGRLFNIAQLLGVDVDYFFDDVTADIYKQLPAYKRNYGTGLLQEDQIEQSFDPMGGAEATMLLKAFYSLPAKARNALLVMLTSLREKEDAIGE